MRPRRQEEAHQAPGSKGVAVADCANPPIATRWLSGQRSHPYTVLSSDSINGGTHPGVTQSSQGYDAVSWYHASYTKSCLILQTVWFATSVRFLKRTKRLPSGGGWIRFAVTFWMSATFLATRTQLIYPSGTLLAINGHRYMEGC